MGMMPSTQKLIEAGGRQDQQTKKIAAMGATVRASGRLPSNAAYFREAWIGRHYDMLPVSIDDDANPITIPSFQMPRRIDYAALPRVSEGVVPDGYDGQRRRYALEVGESHPDAASYVRDLEAEARRRLPFARFIAAPVIKVENAKGEMVSCDAAYIELRKNTCEEYSFPLAIPTILLSSALPTEKAEKAFWGVFFDAAYWEGGRIWNEIDGDGEVSKMWLDDALMSLELVQDASKQDYSMTRTERMRDAFVRFATTMLATGSLPVIPENPADDDLLEVKPHTRVFVEMFIGVTGEQILRMRNPGWWAAADDREHFARAARKDAARLKAKEAALAAMAEGGGPRRRK